MNMHFLGEPRTFPKSWGAEFIREGEVRFRIWAPGAESLKLRLNETDEPMSAMGEGWFELLATNIAPNTPYAFVLPDGLAVPDPASRAQAGDVHGPSLVIDPTSYPWQDSAWKGRPWPEAVLYEVHVGTFTPEGTFRAAIGRLDHLVELGITAVEIMPVAQFSGDRGWGYDGVLLYAPHRIYGTPDDMKAFIDAAHERGLMVLLDVVYNHFGPDGNYLNALAPSFFHPEHRTPWGAAIAYEKNPVRHFFIENALYWLDEFHLDGLRLDAIDQIRDPESATHILVEIAERTRSELPGRHIHLTTEDNRNITSLHERGADNAVIHYTAEWNDDFHNAAHVLATGETDGYYEDFAGEPWRKLAKALTEGFVYQGEVSPHSGGKPRGRPSGHLPPTVFIGFLQNHDQIGNRAFGERLSSLASAQVLRSLYAVLLLAPHIPLLFMGEEWGETRPFCFFTDFHGELAETVRNGRREEFAKFAAFTDAHKRESIPDPNAETTFLASKIDWERPLKGHGRAWLAYIAGLLDLRRRHIAPLLAAGPGQTGALLKVREGLVAVDWDLSGARLQLRANFLDREQVAPPVRGDVVFAGSESAGDSFEPGRLPPHAVVWAIEPRDGRRP